MGKNLSRLTWVEAKSAFEKTKLALVPVGSIEQHGPHMPLGTDTRIAEYLANKASEHLDCIVTPVIPVGNADYHSDFQGTLAVDSDVLKEYVKSICCYLVEYGITHIMIVNGHGGNLNSLLKVSSELRDEKGIPVGVFQWWDVAGLLDEKWSMIGHGDITETSIMLEIDEKSVKLENAKVPKNKWLTDKLFCSDRTVLKFGKGFFHMGLRTGDVTETGDFIEYGHSTTADYSISPADATKAKGKEVLNLVTRYLVEALKELTKVKLQPKD